MKGQTLIETVAALGISIVIITAITLTVLVSLNSTQFSKNQNLGTQYAQEGMEIMRQFQSSSWGTLLNLSGTYCLPKGSTAPVTGTNCSFDTTFTREVIINQNSRDCYNATPTKGPPSQQTVYDNYQITCGTPASITTPNDMCKAITNARYNGAASGTDATGYWWKECGGASVSNCNGLTCTVNALDCTNTAGDLGSQNPLFNGSPYPTGYIKSGTSTTPYKPTDLGLSCPGSSPGWTVRLACTLIVNPTSPPGLQSSDQPVKATVNVKWTDSKCNSGTLCHNVSLISCFSNFNVVPPL